MYVVVIHAKCPFIKKQVWIVNQNINSIEIFQKNIYIKETRWWPMQARVHLAANDLK